MQNNGGNQQPKTEAPKPPTDQGKPAIPVKRIQFAQSIDIPEKSVADNVPISPRESVFDADGKRINRQKAWLVDYLPWMRAFRVTYYPPSHAMPPQQRMIGEAMVRSWDPVTPL